MCSWGVTSMKVARKSAAFCRDREKVRKDVLFAHFTRTAYIVLFELRAHVLWTVPLATSSYVVLHVLDILQSHMYFIC